MQQQDNIVAAVPRKVYSNAHAYHIHSISVNSDQETYISADDLRVNLWNLNISDQSFSRCTLTSTCITALTQDRHCGHQTCKHGGAHGGHYCRGVPPNSVQRVYVFKLEEQHQARRHARLCALRPACEKCVCPPRSIFSTDRLVMQCLRKRRTRLTDHSSPKSFRQSLTSSSVTMGGTFCRGTTSRSRSGISTWSRSR